ncbi:hypothetical protein F5878DRAFT_615362 [Lentinula raphanica]|uniref:Uncharacterized protein n=1 Tax=Lentinula raphanica TaxID=153919 RepID=A0AA38UFY8_9AGAR|nr:hypothetical protein F5880DRAFT_1598667 [Lentinula raphanica]KAJ3839730.1 hypothetical protein F5878DRAFT_615362 [Lentinula raphanica]
MHCLILVSVLLSTLFSASVAAPTMLSCSIYIRRTVMIEPTLTKPTDRETIGSDEEWVLEICGRFYYTYSEGGNLWKLVEGRVDEDVHNVIKLGSFSITSVNWSVLRAKIRKISPTVSPLWMYEVLESFRNDETFQNRVQHLQINWPKLTSIFKQMFQALGNGLGSKVVGREQELYESVLREPAFQGS